MFNAQQALARSLVALAFVVSLACAQDPTPPTPSPASVHYEIANAGELTRRQAAIWIPIVFVVFTVGAVYALYGIDDPKHRDTILYAKFIANLKEKQN